MERRPILSVIIPARNGEAMTSSCLSAAIHSVDALDLPCEFILIDDASEPDENVLAIFQRARKTVPQHRFKIFRTRRRQHYTGVFSLGLSAATCDQIFFLSNDMIVTPIFISTLLQVSALGQDIGIVRGTSNYADAHPEHTVVPGSRISNYDEVLAFSGEVARQHGSNFTEDKLLSGDAVLIKRALVDAIGVMDLRFFGYFGDVDYGMRAHLAGFKLVCAKGAWLLHHGGGHVRREIALDPERSLVTARARRMELVEAAYGEFRGKWGGDLPEQYDNVRPLHFFEIADRNRDRVALKYDLPPAFRDQYDQIDP
jgi:GT2 family glycosyltransferase